MRRRTAHVHSIAVGVAAHKALVIRVDLVARLLQQPVSNLLHARIALDLGVGTEIGIAHDTPNALVKVVDRVGHEQPLVARPVIVRLLKVEPLLVHIHLAHLKVRLAAHGLLKRGHLAACELADGAPRLVRVHVHLAANDKDAVREELVVGEIGGQQWVAEFGALGHVRPVHHGRHREHVVGFLGAETAYRGLVPSETGLFVVRDGKVARGVEGNY